MDPVNERHVFNLIVKSASQGAQYFLLTPKVWYGGVCVCVAMPIMPGEDACDYGMQQPSWLAGLLPEAHVAVHVVKLRYKVWPQTFFNPFSSALTNRRALLSPSLLAFSHCDFCCLQVLQNLEYSDAVTIHIVNNGQEILPCDHWDLNKFLSWMLCVYMFVCEHVMLPSKSSVLHVSKHLVFLLSLSIDIYYLTTLLLYSDLSM